MKFTTLLTVAMTGLLPTTALADWNGTYLGGSFGSAGDLEYDNENFPAGDGTFEDTESFGLFFGTMAQQGNAIYGGEIAYSVINDAEGPSDAFEFDALLDLKAIAGTTVGDAIIYGILSASVAYGEDPGSYESAGGLGLGIGSALMVGPDFSISAEYLTRSMSEEFSDTTVDVTAETVTLRGAYHF